MDGEVVSAGWGGSGGYTITIRSLDGEYRFSYCHASPEMIVSIGQQVKKGEIIGKVGPKNASKYFIDNIGEIKKIVKLSTCSYLNSHTTPTNQRYFLVASLEKID